MSARDPKVLFVCGRFDDQRGRASGYMAKVAEAAGPNVETVNGGRFAELALLVRRAASERFDALWWMPDVDNSHPKVVESIKDAVPRCILVTSKNNSTGKYAIVDIVSRMLKARANMALTIDSASPFKASILDPLGNAFAVSDPDAASIGRALYARTRELANFTRTASVRIGPAIDAPASDEIESFAGIVRAYAAPLHEMVHGANPSRFLGNASFRCTRGGFPAFTSDGKLFVSKRNLDKRDLSPDSFVAVEPKDEGPIAYYGDHKPSVDAPIQRALFAALPWARFMLHAHAYAHAAPTTGHIVPCGALEEVPEVLNEIGVAKGLAVVNLKGHGFIAIASEPWLLAGIRLSARPIPETHQKVAGA